MSDTLTLDPELRAKAEAHIRDQVTLGFADENEIIEGTLDYFEGQDFDSDALEAHTVQATRAAIAAHCKAQQTWPAVTDCDRLDAVFARLEAEGIVARQNFTCCQTCGHAEIWDEIRATQKQQPVTGYVFYHAQDTESALYHGALYLAFGAVEKGKAATLTVAQRAAAVLREAGFTVEWNGSVKQRISLTGLDWKKRREDCR